MEIGLIQTLTKSGGSAAAQSPVVKNLYYATVMKIVMRMGLVLMNDSHSNRVHSVHALVLRPSYG